VEHGNSTLTESNTVRDRVGHREAPVEFESVGAIAVGGLLLQVLGKIDDLNGLEGAFFDADTATNAQLLRQRRGFHASVRLNAELSHPHHWATLFTLLLTAFWFAFIIGNDGNTGQGLLATAVASFIFTFLPLPITELSQAQHSVWHITIASELAIFSMRASITFGTIQDHPSSPFFSHSRLYVHLAASAKD